MSSLVQVIVAPGAMFIGFGAYAVVVRVDAPRTIDTGVPVPGDGVGLGATDEELQPTDVASRTRTRPIDNFIVVSPIALP